MCWVTCRCTEPEKIKNSVIGGRKFASLSSMILRRQVFTNGMIVFQGKFCIIGNPLSKTQGSVHESCWIFQVAAVWRFVLFCFVLGLVAFEERVCRSLCTQRPLSLSKTGTKFDGVCIKRLADCVRLTTQVQRQVKLMIASAFSKFRLTSGSA